MIVLGKTTCGVIISSFLILLVVSHSAIAKHSRDLSGLLSKVGETVTLQGRFDGPGKIADYIVVADGGSVYLTGESKPNANSTEYGTEVVVRGKLQHYVPPPSDSRPPDPNGQPRGVCPEHLFIESAEFLGVIVAVTFTGGHETDPRDHGRPVVLIANALGAKPEVFRKAFSGVTPARGRAPTGEDQRRNKEALMKVLGPYKVTNERLDEVSDYYRYRPEKGELWPTKEAKAYVVVNDGEIKKFVVTESGSGYSSPPKALVKGFESLRLEAKVMFDTDLKRNGRIESVEKISNDRALKPKSAESGGNANSR